MHLLLLSCERFIDVLLSAYAGLIFQGETPSDFAPERLLYHHGLYLTQGR